MRDAMELDTFELKLNVKEDEEHQTLISYSIYINQRNIAPNNEIDLVNLALSCQQDGEFYIINCECGVPECAGIRQGVKVTNTENHIIWKVPKQPNKLDHNADDIGFDRYTFNREQLIMSAQKAIIKTRKIAFGEKFEVGFAMLNFKQDDLLTLSFQRIK